MDNIIINRKTYFLFIQKVNDLLIMIICKSYQKAPKMESKEVKVKINMPFSSFSHGPIRSSRFHHQI